MGLGPFRIGLILLVLVEPLLAKEHQPLHPNGLCLVKFLAHCSLVLEVVVVGLLALLGEKQLLFGILDLLMLALLVGLDDLEPVVILHILGNGTLRLLLLLPFIELGVVEEHDLQQLRSLFSNWLFF